MQEYSVHVRLKIIRIMLLVTLVSSVSFLVQDLHFNKTQPLNYVWLINIGVTLLIGLLLYKKKDQETVIFIFFNYIIFFAMPLSWISSAIANSIEFAYIFILLVSISFFYNGSRRLHLLAATILISTLLLLYQFLYPGNFSRTSQLQNFILILTHMPILLGFATYLLILFSDTLNNSNKLLIKTSHFDALTGLYSRHYIYEYLNFVKKTSSYDNPTLIGLIDVDNFKQVNDTQGHLNGDLILKKIASHIFSSFQHCGIVGRYGGDEFIIIITNSHTIDYPKVLASVSTSNKEEVTLSGGFALFTGAEELDQVLSLADKRLYHAKRHGKNHIIHSS